MGSRAEDMDRVRTKMARVYSPRARSFGCGEGECRRSLTSSWVLMTVISQMQPLSSLSGRRRC